METLADWYAATDPLALLRATEVASRPDRRRLSRLAAAGVYRLVTPTFTRRPPPDATDLYPEGRWMVAADRPALVRGPVRQDPGEIVALADRIDDGRDWTLDDVFEAFQGHGTQWGWEWSLCGRYYRHNLIVNQLNQLIDVLPALAGRTDGESGVDTMNGTLARMCPVVRDVFPPPARLPGREHIPRARQFRREWRTGTAVALARHMWAARDFSAMPVLADALQDAGCDNPGILDHCRDARQPHCRGCRVLEMVLHLKRKSPHRVVD